MTNIKHSRGISPFKKTERNEKILQMRLSGMTLQEIADVFHVSRERIRQLAGNLGYWANEVQKRNLAQLPDEELLNLTTAEARAKYTRLCGCGIIKKMATVHHKNNCQGSKAEEIVSKKLKSIGLDNALMGWHNPYDILLNNGYCIDVKAPSIPQHAPSQKDISPKYAINHLKNGKDCDFFILVLPTDFDDPTLQYFVVPSVRFKSLQAAKVTYPGKRKAVWIERYHNRFDLLQK
jgi:hypothetical protein